MKHRQQGSIATMMAAIIATVVAVALTLFAAHQAGIATILIGGHAAPSKSAVEANPSSLTLVCEVSQLTPVNGLDAPAAAQTRTLVVGIDINGKTGWYQGDFVMSEGRKGSLESTPEQFNFSRPAMFERFGEMIFSEQVTIDRTTGELNQSLTFRGDRTIKLVRGVCGRLIRAPF